MFARSSTVTLFCVVVTVITLYTLKKAVLKSAVPQIAIAGILLLAAVGISLAESRGLIQVPDRVKVIVYLCLGSFLCLVAPHHK